MRATHTQRKLRDAQGDREADEELLPVERRDLEILRRAVAGEDHEHDAGERDERGDDEVEVEADGGEQRAGEQSAEQAAEEVAEPAER